MERNEAIARIRKALKERTGKTWSVRGGTGTSWGWIDVDAPPARRVYDSTGARLPEGETGYTHPDELKELAKVLGIDSVHHQGLAIPASTSYRQEYVDRAEGRTPSVKGMSYWD